MNTLSPDEPAASVSSASVYAAVSPDVVRQQRRWLVALALVLCIAVIGLMVHLWLDRQEMVHLREEMAKRLKTGDTANTEIRGMTKSMQDTVLDLQTRFAALENRQAESQNQHMSLEQMYLELSKNRDDRILTDIEQILLMANQQLQLSGNVHSTLIALENADRLLAREDKPQFIGIRRALTKDIERLRAVPHVDVTGMAVKFDVLIAQVGSLPLLSDVGARHEPESEKEKAAQTDKAQPTGDKKVSESQGGAWFSPVSRIWARWSSEFWSEVRSLVRVRNVETPDALILSPSQAYFLRENLTLRLLGARVAMLARDHVSFASDTKAAMKAIDTYFDPTSPQVQAAKTVLSHILTHNVAVEMPTLSDSLTALQNHRTKP